MLEKIEKPEIETAELKSNGTYGKFILEPLERGYGITLGNSLRRVLLSSLPGVAVTSVKIDGVHHELSTIPGVKEDVTEIILNLKGLTAKLYGEGPKTIYIEAEGECVVTAGDIETMAYEEGVDVDELMQKAEGELFQLSQNNMKQDYTQIDPVVKEAVAILQRAAQNSGGLTGIPTGYRGLDDMTSGWQPSDLVIIAGRPAMGKTSFALSIAKNVAVDYDVPIGFFSLEMNNVQLVNRLISNVCEISGKKILNGQLEQPEWERLDQKLRKLTGAPIYIDDTPGLSVFELRTKARRLVREKGVKLLMIDYLQLMNANGMKFGSRQEEVSTISRSLKGIAKELNIPVLALSQLSRNVENREGLEGKRPQLSDLRESGAIEQDADMVLFVHRPEYYHIYQDEKGNDLHGMAQIIIAKHRKGSVGDVLLNFRGEFTRFQDPQDAAAAPVEEGGEIVGSRMNGGGQDGSPLPPPPAENLPF